MKSRKPLHGGFPGKVEEEETTAQKIMRWTSGPGWSARPISRTCERVIWHSGTLVVFCGRPTEKAYPAHGGGFCALCEVHGRKHTEAPWIGHWLVAGFGLAEPVHRRN